MRHKFSLLLVQVLLVVGVSLWAGQQSQIFVREALVKDSEEAACSVLKTRFAELYMGGRTDRYWFCDFTTIKNDYVRIIGLRSRAPRTDGATIYSNLLGWYGVARRSHVVVQWDVNEDRLIPIGATYDEPIVEESQEAACEVLRARIGGVLATNGRPDPAWTCEFSSKTNMYLHIVALRSASPTGQPTAGKLVGTFAVAKRSSVVLEFEEAGNRLIALRGSATK